MASAPGNLWAFLSAHKRYWLLPVVIVGGVLLTLALASKSNPVGAFVYTLF